MPAGMCFLFLLCSKRVCRNVAVSRARAPARSRTPARSITHSDAVGYGLWCGERGTQIFCLHSLSLNLGLKSLVHTQDLERRHLLAHWPHKPVHLSAGGTLEGVDDTGLCVWV